MKIHFFSFSRALGGQENCVYSIIKDTVNQTKNWKDKQIPNIHVLIKATYQSIQALTSDITFCQRGKTS